MKGRLTVATIDRRRGGNSWRWLPARERQVLEQFALHGRPGRFLAGLAALFTIFCSPPIVRFTGVGPLRIACLWAGLAAWILAAHRWCYPRARNSAVAFNILVFGNVTVGMVVTLTLVIMSGSPQTPLWLGYCVMACVNGASESEPSILLGAYHLLAPFVTIPFFVVATNPTWAVMGPIVCSLASGYGYFFLAARGQIWRQERHEEEMNEAKRRLEEVERERLRLARDLHDTVGTTLSLVSLYGALAEGAGSSAESSRLATTIRDAARSGLQELRDVLNRLPQSPTTLEQLAGSLELMARRSVEPAGVTFSTELAGGRDVVIGGDVRAAVIRVVQEAIHNAVRHGEARRIETRFAADPQRLEVVIKDDGGGFETGVRGAGMGLPGMEARARDLGGVVLIDSARGRGTRITLDLPLEANQPQ